MQIDIVPRLFELVGLSASVHWVEGMPLLGLPTVRAARVSRAVKRAIDVLVAGAALVALAPLLAYIALRIRLDSQGPVLFRQTRLGTHMKEFTVLKFRTMKVDTDESVHRSYIQQTMSPTAVTSDNGLYKLDRTDAITNVGRWLRKTSLDELPQLVNVLLGDMSLVGPRPCIPYEAESFESQHLQRFSVPQGLTGLWQVTARASSTYGEALDMDVAYARGWSLGLDLRLLLRTTAAGVAPAIVDRLGSYAYLLAGRCPHDAVEVRVVACAGAVADTELAVDVREVELHRLPRDPQLLCDLVVGGAGRDQVEDPQLPAGQRRVLVSERVRCVAERVDSGGRMCDMAFQRLV